MTRWTTLQHGERPMGSVCIHPHVSLPLPSPSPSLTLLLVDNYPQPGKRPLSSTAPTVIEDASSGALHLVLGGSGGSRIFGSIVQVMLGLDWGLDISAAIEQPRVHDQLFPPFVSIESGLDSGEIAALVGKGHPAIGEFFRVGLGIGAEH